MTFNISSTGDVSVDPTNSSATSTFSVRGRNGWSFAGGISWGAQPVNIQAPGGLNIAAVNAGIQFNSVRQFWAPSLETTVGATIAIGGGAFQNIFQSQSYYSTIIGYGAIASVPVTSGFQRITAAQMLWIITIAGGTGGGSGARYSTGV